MSDAGPPRELYPRRSRLPVEMNPFGGAMKRGAVLLYGLLTVGLIGLAAYMALVRGLPLTSGYVAAPAAGAIWFALRLFMTMAPRR